MSLRLRKWFFGIWRGERESEDFEVKSAVRASPNKMRNEIQQCRFYFLYHFAKGTHFSSVNLPKSSYVEKIVESKLKNLSRTVRLLPTYLRVSASLGKMVVRSWYVCRQDGEGRMEKGLVGWLEGRDGCSDFSLSTHFSRSAARA